MIVLAGLLASCAEVSSAVRDSGPRLVQDVTLPPVATVWISAGPPAASTTTPIVLPVLPAEQSTPLQVVTIQSDFVLVTPTLPPSKTPTPTPTQTRTPTPTSTPMALPVVPQVSLLVPTSVLATVTSPFTILPTAPSLDIVISVFCTTGWFFVDPQPTSCPLNPPLVSAAAFLRFERGYMLWIGEQDAVYVLYDDPGMPNWEVFPDRFEDGMPERDESLIPPADLWQPKRGFGLVWRTYNQVRNRLGWAVRDAEEGYTAQVQIGGDGTVYVEDQRRGVFALMPSGGDWQWYPNIRN